MNRPVFLLRNNMITYRAKRILFQQFFAEFNLCERKVFFMYASTVLICMEFLSAGGIDIAMLFQPLNCLFRCFRMNRCQEGGYHHSKNETNKFFHSLSSLDVGHSDRTIFHA